MPLPSADFDPTESAVPWQILTERNFDVFFATPDGSPGQADERMLLGKGLGIWRPILIAHKNARVAYQKMINDERFRNPIPYRNLKPEDFSGLILPGGHAPGMKEYLESDALQKFVGTFFSTGKPLGAICHGVVLAARSKQPGTGLSILHGKKTTALLKSQELAAWNLTRLWLGDYYRTYPQTVEDEVRSVLKDPGDFFFGPKPVFRDSHKKLKRGHVVVDGNYVSARWPGDAYSFANSFINLF
ncbi:type 1 glutamine amidotransferase domain-containing protein [Leptospira ellisii]|uniref:Type 1 glutamine amidotransferase domain-containing protein n=1 Tax=Leptospira ellisii TaxID=2023197 RepID=A0AAE4QRJ4_9LEPT|nr:type 1 glutamine amidotransferase domain-containing protein [Leptospira ellisii]MDV6237700.1 type 1 glutamine amidotransferase domain-containing protein [Leptospira ellisii]